MVMLYVILIRNGLKKIEDIPERFRAEVQAMMDAESSD